MTSLEQQIAKPRRRKTASQHETFQRPALLRNRLVKWSIEKKSGVQWMLM